MEGHKQGFTLIELLVVMAIIGILAALSLTSFSTAQKNSRDTRRKSDLQQYRNALEAYASNNEGKYPMRESRIWGTGDIDPPAGVNIFLNDGAAGTNGPLITEYLPGNIRPPYDSMAWWYLYRIDSSAQRRYTITANLESGEGVWQVCSDGRAGKVLWANYTDSISAVCDVP